MAAQRSYRYRCVLAVLMTVLLCACSASKGNKAADSSQAGLASETDYSLPDTLRIGTLYSPDSYFLYRDEPMGYEYELATRFAEDYGIPVKIVVAGNFHDMLSQLEEGKTDLVAYNVPMTAEYKEELLYCGPDNETHQVLVQPLVNGKPAVTDVTQLPRRTVYVERDSKYYYRLRNLDAEVGGGIDIKALDRDSLVTEDMIEMVSSGKIPYTVIDSDIANFSSGYYDNIDVSLAVGMQQRGSWAVRKDNGGLAVLIDEWAGKVSTDDASRRIYRRYFEESKRIPARRFAATGVALCADGSISPYDDIFRRYAGELDWDWRMLAAQAFVESGFDVEQVSWAGARGLMQLMPGTAKAFGCPTERIRDPELNVKAAVRCLRELDSSLARKVPQRTERLKFVLAAYNSGIAHILDAMALAGKYGMDPTRWDGNVRRALMLKSQPEYYNDPVVKYGFFRATQTVEYVDKVLDIFEKYKALKS